MIIDIKVPEAGESITQVELARWLVENGQYVEKDQEIAEIDSDKATLTINAEKAGIISIALEEGSSTEPGKVIGSIDTSASKPERPESEKETETSVVVESAGDEGNKIHPRSDEEPSQEQAADDNKNGKHHSSKDITLTPQAQKLLDEMGIDPIPREALPDGRRITRKDVLAAIVEGARNAGSSPQTEKSMSANTVNQPSWGGNRNEDRQKMSTLRRKIAERLVAVKNQTAMLTTFNEVDMSAIISLRKNYQDAFVKRHGIKLGFMSFFAKALAESIPWFPQVNGYIDGDHMVIPDYADIGIAVSTPKGLMVPVIRNAESLSLAGLEVKIQEMAARARDNKISLEELKGGTISITNGGIFGSMLSTPIINPPQSAILGMHNIVERPIAVNGQVVIRPMMYLALSYDHRIVDGKESVGFLVKVKEMIENPLRLLAGGNDPETLLLGL